MISSERSYRGVWGHYIKITTLIIQEVCFHYSTWALVAYNTALIL